MALTLELTAEDPQSSAASPPSRLWLACDGPRPTFSWCGANDEEDRQRVGRGRNLARGTGIWRRSLASMVVIPVGRESPRRSLASMVVIPVGREYGDRSHARWPLAAWDGMPSAAPARVRRLLLAE